MQTHAEEVKAMEGAMTALEDGLKRLEHEVERLSLSDVREWLLFYVEVSKGWSTVKDLKAMKGTMMLAIAVVGQEMNVYVGEDLRRVLKEICAAIDLMFCIGER